MSREELYTQAQVDTIEYLAKGFAKAEERDRINGIIDQFIENSDYPEVISSLEWLQDVIGGENK